MSGGGGGGGGETSAEEKALYQAQADIAREQWDEYKMLGSPIQAQVASEAGRPTSESEYATNIGRAGADVDQSFDQATTEFRSGLSRYGLNPGSGRFASGLRSLSLGRAASKAGAMTGARGDLQSRRDQLRFGALSGLQGQQGRPSRASRLRRPALGVSPNVHRRRSRIGRLGLAVCWAPARWPRQCFFPIPG